MRDMIAASFSIAAFCLAILTLIPAALIVYWAVDRTPPIRHLMGQFIQWESLNPPIVKIKWMAERSRLCLGETTSWIFAEKAMDLPSSALPHRDAINKDGSGSVSWTESIPIPPEAMKNSGGDIVLSVRFTWYCNPLQEYWPIEMDAPLINLPIPDRFN